MARNLQELGLVPTNRLKANYCLNYHYPSLWQTSRAEIQKNEIGQFRLLRLERQISENWALCRFHTLLAIKDKKSVKPPLAALGNQDSSVQPLGF